MASHLRPPATDAPEKSQGSSEKDQKEARVGCGDVSRGQKTRGMNVLLLGSREEGID